VSEVTTTLLAPVLALEGVRVWTERGSQLIHPLDWTVRAGEHWALLGPNGAGKTTLLSVAGAVRFPSAGGVTVLGRTFGKVDLRELRRFIGVVDSARRLPVWLTAGDVVLTGASGTIQPDWARYGDAERARAAELLELLGCAALADRKFTTLSAGERQRVRIARALMPTPPLLLLDEPAAGLDLPAREALLAALSQLASVQPDLATVLVSHHLEELPGTTTHALLLRHGAAVASGPVPDVLTNQHISACFGLDVQVARTNGRWTAQATAGWTSRNGAVPGE
jgi:iron complex transport system ATP-binding protein